MGHKPQQKHTMKANHIQRLPIIRRLEPPRPKLVSRWLAEPLAFSRPAGFGKHLAYREWLAPAYVLQICSKLQEYGSFGDRDV